MKENDNNKVEHNYISKVWITTSIVAFITILLLILEATFSVFLLIFAGILIAVFFTGLSSLLQRVSKWNEKVCLGISIVGALAIIVGFFWLIGAQIQSQFDELADTLPKTIENARNQLKDTTIGDKLIESVTSEESTKKLQSFSGKFFRSTFGVFGDLYVVIFIGIFLSVAPNTYTNGFVALIPERGQDRAKKIFNALGEQLRN